MRIDEDFKNELATVIDHGFSLSSENKTPFVWFDFKFDNLVSEKNEALEARAQLYLTDNTIEHSLKKLSALGWHGDNICELDPNEDGSFKFKDQKAVITGHIEEYNGKRYPKVDWINDPNYSPVATIDAESKEALNVKLKGKIAAYRAKNPVKSGVPI